jgi:hypothetical protein
MNPSELRVELLVDDEGVVRVLHASADVVELDTVELGQLLTALLKALVGPDGDEQRIDVSLN